MKEVFQKITSLLLAVLVLASTVSFTIEKHYCGRFLVDVAVFSEAKDCGMDMMSYSNDLHVKTMKKSCCKDEVLVIEGQDELKMTFDKIELQQQVFITSFVYSYLKLFEASEERNLGFKEYSPPDLVRNILVLHETYLI
ncbi:HYC_CC_PP family protein [Aquimarina sp. 2201CG5-10]|uniref:HYC_CC_PP family protein n=1 Tax=Aquimarina callyspongiae TaxID=3098150 RepID=UPI002AB42212|nr:hypothetical protein [Aquimarina sp. 2201CG5-10]MDY8134724.1 hypothetical protein [Aquimarina sp. 2201CG5-10]